MKYIYPNLPSAIPPLSLVDYNDEWIAERKKNGWRCLAVRTDKGLELWTRRHTLIKDPLPETRANLLRLPVNTMLDGELMEKRTKEIKDKYYAFDIIFFKNQPLVHLAWTERRKYLEYSLLSNDIGVDISSPVRENFKSLYDVSVEEGDEGVVIKKATSPYVVDLRSCPANPYWLKAKRPEPCFRTGV